jgi:hypothetical protein
MNSSFPKREIEQVKPLTERRRTERLAYVDVLLAQLRRLDHYPPCRRNWTPDRPTQGECSCWQGFAIDFLEREKLVLGTPAERAGQS